MKRLYLLGARFSFLPDAPPAFLPFFLVVFLGLLFTPKDMCSTPNPLGVVTPFFLVFPFLFCAVFFAFLFAIGCAVASFAVGGFAAFARRLGRLVPLLFGFRPNSHTLAISVTLHIFFTGRCVVHKPRCKRFDLLAVYTAVPYLAVVRLRHTVLHAHDLLAVLARRENIDAALDSLAAREAPLHLIVPLLDGISVTLKKHMLLFGAAGLASICLVTCHGAAVLSDTNTQACPSISASIAHSRMSRVLAAAASCMALAAVVAHYALHRTSLFPLVLAAACTVVCLVPTGSNNTESRSRHSGTVAAVHNCAALVVALTALAYMVALRSTPGQSCLIIIYASLILVFLMLTASRARTCRSFDASRSLTGTIEYMLLIVFTFHVLEAHFSKV